MIVNRLRFKIASLVFTYLLFLAGDPGTVIAIPPPANSNDIQAKLPWVRRQGASKAQGVIVFVHGVLGDDFTSWQNGSSYWPELLIHDQTFDGQDIYVYKYPSPKLGKSFSISEVADNLRLVLSTDGVLKYKQITFVSHSMGGLVTRDFIVKYQSQVVPKIRLLAFFATPTTGTPYARLGALISKNPQFGQLYPLDSDNYLGTLQSNWLAGNFRIRSYCAYEVLPTFGQIIVERASATNLCTERLDPINANHFDIVKPLDAKSEVYRVLVSAFEETARGSRSSPRKAQTIHEGSVPHPLPPLIKEDIWSVLIPYNDGDGDPIPTYKMTAADAEKFLSVGLFYTRISGWSRSALEGRGRPQTPEAINSFLEEIVRYHVFDWVDQLQHDRYSQSWDYRTGAKSNAILANAPPDFVEYPKSKIIDLISDTPLSSVGDVMTYWQSRTDSFRVPANTTLQFLTTPENGADAYRIQISNPSLCTLTLSVLHGVTLLNYGFVPPQFELTPETIKHTRSYNIAVKGRLEFKRFSDTDPLLQDEYVKWAEGLFAGLRKSMVTEAGPVLPQPAPSASEIADEVAKRLPENKAVVHAKSTNGASITEDVSGNMHDTVSAKVRRQPTNAQMEIIKDIERLVISRDESTLRQAFGFPSMMETNIRMNVAIVRHFEQADGKVLDLRPYLGTEWMLDSELAEGHVRRFGGGFQYDPPDGKRVYLLALPSEYSVGKKVLFKFENSTELPTTVVGAIKNLDDAVYENANQLLHVLNTALKKDPDYYLRYDDQTSLEYFHKIDAMWLDSFVQLRPKADGIRDAIREYFQME